MTTTRPLPAIGLVVPCATKTMHPKTGRPCHAAVAKGGPLALLDVIRKKLEHFPAGAPVLITTPGGFMSEEGDHQRFDQMLRGWGSVVEYLEEMDAWQALVAALRIKGHAVAMHLGAPRICQGTSARYEVVCFTAGHGHVALDATAQSSDKDTDDRRYDISTTKQLRRRGCRVIIEGWLGSRSPWWGDPEVLCWVTTDNFRGIHERAKANGWRAHEHKPIDEWAYTGASPYERLIGVAQEKDWQSPLVEATTLEMIGLGCSVFVDVYPDGKLWGKTPQQILEAGERGRGK